MSRLSRRLRAGYFRGDAGMTLLEVTVAMTVMATFLALSSAALIGLYRTANTTLAAAGSQAVLNTAFLRLDKEIRYSAGVSTPGPVGSDPYVEYLTNNTGTAVCTELRVVAATGLLQRRSWTQGMTPLKPDAWTTLATDVSPTSPFTVLSPDGSFDFQRLRLTVVAGQGLGARAVKRTVDVTFTLLNTTRGTDSAAVCKEGRSVL